MSAGHRRISIELGSGETFLHFDEAMLFLDHLRCLAAARDIRIDARIITNGTLASEERLQTCLRNRISLCFSIDGPASGHDSFRKSCAGKPTHRIALQNWRRYRRLAGAVADGPGCEVYSVVAGDARLREVARFWRKQRVTRFKAIPAEPNKLPGRSGCGEWQAGRTRYLEDLEALAFSEAARLRGRDLAEEAVGPLALLDSWRRLSNSAPYRSCGAGYSAIAVDADGTIFPCQGFFGSAERSIGDVRSGVLPAKLAEFRSARSRVEAACSGCWARFLCDGGCCASDPKTGVVLDAWSECAFFQSHAEIAIRSYQDWRARRAEFASRKGTATSVAPPGRHGEKGKMEGAVEIGDVIA
jgi:uncharacterized protein